MTKIFFPEQYPTELLHHLPKEQIEANFGSIFNVPESLQQFIAEVNRAYWEAEAYKKLLERVSVLSGRRGIVPKADQKRSNNAE